MPLLHHQMAQPPSPANAVCFSHPVSRSQWPPAAISDWLLTHSPSVSVRPRLENHFPLVALYFRLFALASLFRNFIVFNRPLHGLWLFYEFHDITDGIPRHVLYPLSIPGLLSLIAFFCPFHALIPGGVFPHLGLVEEWLSLAW